LEIDALSAQDCQGPYYSGVVVAFFQSSCGYQPQDVFEAIPLSQRESEPIGINAERQDTNLFRIYAKVHYLSFLIFRAGINTVGLFKYSS
jgi:hypothetical protein